MLPSNLIRWGGLAAIAAGIAYVVDALLELLMPSAPSSVVHLLAVLLTLVAMVGLHTLQKANYGGIGRGGFYTVVVALLAQALGRIADLLGNEAFGWLVFPVGIFVMMVGLVLYGAATLQARVLPRWCGLGFIVVPPLVIVLAISFGEYGELVFGLLWLAVGYVLWSRRGTVTEQPSRVS